MLNRSGLNALGLNTWPVKAATPTQGHRLRFTYDAMGNTTCVEDPDGGIAVVIARHPCVIAYRDEAISEKIRVTITEDCVECNFCIDRFECPALYHDPDLGRTQINRQICADCGLCLQVCPKGAIVEVKD